MKSINEAGRVRDKQTIAGLIENGRFFNLLGERGIDYIQGYITGMPLPNQELNYVKPFV